MPSSIRSCQPPLINAFGTGEFPHCGKGTDQLRRRFRLKQHGVEDGCKSENGACAQDPHAQTCYPEKDGQGPEVEFGAGEICSREDLAKALVAARDPGE
jgi:hypothetical protein